MLFVFFGVQQWFLFRQIQKLTDKVMSGNYATYTQSQALVNESMKPSGFSVKLPQDEGLDELAQLNAMIKPPF